MKTSNKLLIAALIVLLSSLTAYNMGLKAEFEKASYKDPYRNHSAIPVNNFDEVNINAGHLLNVQIIAGDKHEVYLQHGIEEVVKVTQAGNTLSVDVALTEQHDQVRGWQGAHIIIKTPELKLLRTDAVHTLNGAPVTNLQKSRVPYYYLVTVKGLQQDKLVMELDKGSSVKLEESRINSLQANLGNSAGSETMLQLMAGNSVQAAHLDVQSKSHLVVQDLSIPQLSYNFSDRAQLEISGASLSMISSK